MLHMDPIHRLALAVLVALTVSACRATHGNRTLASLPLAPAFGTASQMLLEDTREPGDRGWRLTLVAGVPSWSETQVNERVGSGLRQVRVSAVNLWPLWLPFAVDIERRHVERSHATPIATGRDVTITPLASWSREWSLSDDEPRVVASGVPLLWSHVGLTGGDHDSAAEVTTTLWSLGPWWMSWDRRDALGDVAALQALVPSGMDIAAERGERGWVVVPLGLAGLGQLLWTSRTWTDPAGDERGEGWRHGPLGGWLGWAHGRGEQDLMLIDGTPGGRLQQRATGYDVVLGGALWFSYRSHRHGSWNGPLWGMFGWGSTPDDQPLLRLLWMPVRL